jgi:hypothetical protein
MNLLGIRKYKKVGIKIIFSLLLLSTVSCGENKEPADINGKDVTKIVAEDVTKLFSESSRKYEISSVQTPENLFLEIAKRQVAEDVVLHPNLTYRITYRKWNFKTDQCDAMAYSVVRDGKLYGDGVVLSQSINWMEVIGYSEKAGDNAMLVTGIAILLTMILVRLLKKIKLDYKAKIIRVGYTESGFGGITISNREFGRTAYVGHILQFVVGTNIPMQISPSSVEIKMVYVNSNGKGELAGGHVKLQQGSSSFISIGELYFPSKPYTDKFICKVWIITAYYADGDVWENKYADEEEKKAIRFIEKKLRKLK